MSYPNGKRTIRYFKRPEPSGLQAEIDPSLPHVLIEKDDAVVVVSTELAHRLSERGRAEIVPDAPEVDAEADVEEEAGAGGQADPPVNVPVTEPTVGENPTLPKGFLKALRALGGKQDAAPAEGGAATERSEPETQVPGEGEKAPAEGAAVEGDKPSEEGAAAAEGDKPSEEGAAASGETKVPNALT